MIYKQNLTSTNSQLGVSGSHLSVIEAPERFTAIIRGADWTVKTELFEGMSLDFTSKGSPVRTIDLVSGTDQVVEFWLGAVNMVDRRMRGEVSIDNTLSNSVTTAVYSFDNFVIAIGENLVNRHSVTFQINKPCYLLFGRGSGILLPAGIHQWNNKGYLKLYSQAVGIMTEVRVMEEKY